MLQADAGADTVDDDEGDAMFLEGTAQLRTRCAMDVMAFTFEVADRAARNRGMLCEVALRPIEKPTRSAAQRG